MNSPELNDKKQEKTSRRIIFVLVLVVVSLLIFGGFELKMNYESKIQAATAQSNLYTALMAFQTAAAQNVAAQEQVKLTLSRQIAANAQLLLRTDNKQRMTALLLSIESMRLSPSGEAAQTMRSAMENPVLQINHRGAAVVSPIGDVIVSGGIDNSIRVWRAFTGEEITRILLLRAPSNIKISPDSRYIASNAYDETEQKIVTYIWETYTGKEITRKVYDGNVSSFSFSPDGNFIVSAECVQRNINLRCKKKIVRIWGVVTGEDINHISYEITYENNPPLVSFSPDGLSVISTTCDQLEITMGCVQSSIRVWEVATGKEIIRITQLGEVISARFSDNGKYILSSSNAGDLLIWSVESGEEVFNKKNSGVITENIVVSPDGRHLAVGWNTIHIWEIETGKEILEIPFLSGSRFITFSPNGKYLAFQGNSSYSTSVVQIWEIDTGKEVFRQLFDSDVYSVAFSPDGKNLIVGGEKINIWEILPGQHGIPDLILPPVTFSLDGRNSIRLDGLNLIVSDIFTGNKIGQVQHPYQDFDIRQMALNANGKYLALGGSDGHVRVWNTIDGKEKFHIVYHNKWVVPITFTTDGKYLALWVDNMIIVWDVLSGKEVSRMPHNAPVLSAAFSPDGKYFISGGQDLTAHVWDSFTGIETSHFYHDGYIQSVAFHPDGRYAAFAGGSSVVVWDVINGKEIKRFVSNAAKVFFSADGRYLLIGADANPALTQNGEYWGSQLRISSVWMVDSWQEISRIPHADNMLPLAFDLNNGLLIFSQDRLILGLKWHPDDLIENACLSVTRNLTLAEWNRYIGASLPYQAVCPNLPIEGQATPFPVITPTNVPISTPIVTSTVNASNSTQTP